MKGLLGIVAAFVGVLMLSSCAPNTLEDLFYKESDRGDQIAEAITDQDAEAIKEMFSSRALESATEIDAQIEYLLSLFPAGKEVTCAYVGGDKSKTSNDFIRTHLARAVFEVTVDGEDFWLFFAEYTRNDPDPENIGLVGLAVATRTESGESEAELAMYEWNGQFDLNEGTPGIYVPEF